MDDTEVRSEETEDSSQSGEGMVMPHLPERYIEKGLKVLLGEDYSYDTLTHTEDDLSLGRDRLNHRLSAIESRRQKNIENVIRSAFDAITLNDNIVADNQTEPSVDWMARFIRQVEDISNPELQSVWAHILALEACQPGRFSLMTLDLLSSFNPDDALLCGQLGCLAYPEGYLFKIDGQNNFDSFGLTESKIFRLQGLGVIWEAEDLGITYHSATKGLSLNYRGDKLVIRHPESELFSFPAFRLSPAGLELALAFADGPVYADYLTAFGDSLRGQGYDYRYQPAGRD